jgi:hypothetical protein
MQMENSKSMLRVLMGEALLLLLIQRILKVDARCSGKDGSRDVTAKVDPTGQGKNFQTIQVITNGNGVSDNPGDIHK